MVEDKVCFVICPIGKAGSETRRRSDLTLKYIINPIVEEFGYYPIRADKISESGMITHQIIDYIIKSPLVIADLTDVNPNVFYELAIRHIVEKPYIQMIKSDQEIPFDVSGMRTILFDTDVEQAEFAKKELKDQIQSIEKNEFKPHNPYTLSTNYATFQNILKNRENIEPNNITDIVLKSVNELRSMMDDMRLDIHNLKGSSNYSRTSKNNTINQANKYRNTLLLQLNDLENQLADYNIMFHNIDNQRDPLKANELKSQINIIEEQILNTENALEELNEIKELDVL